VSFQAITENIVNNASLQTLQLSNTVKDSPKTSNDTSFSELVSYFKNEINTETKESSASQTVSEKTETKKEESASEPVKNEAKTEEPKEKDSKVENTKESKSSDKLSKEEKLEKKYSDNFKIEESEKKSVSSDEKSKKLTKKDFSRIEELTEKDPVLDDVNKFAINVQNKINDKSEIKAEKELELDSNIVSVEENQILTQAVKINTETETETGSFDFKQNDSSDNKKITLDKAGKITVDDQRTEKTQEINVEKKSDIKISEIKQTSENTAVMTMELNQDVNTDVLSLNSQTAASNGSNFQAMLNNQIQNSAPEFVKAGNLILKDNNQGTINLVIHPDDLGNVKIHLSLDGNKISGHITVATKEALEVFKDNAETLREAFIKSGFDAANFDVAFNNGGSFNQNMEFAQQNDGSNLMAKNVYNNNSTSLDSELEAIIENSEDISNYSVNLIA